MDPSQLSVPILDNHFHLDPRGRVEEAVKDFQRSGGTHLMVIHKPYGESPRHNPTVDAHREDYETTLGLVERVREAVPEVTAWCVLGPHPAEFTKHLDAGASMDEAMDVYRGALDLAQEYVLDGKAVAIGEIGRPHWDGVPDDLWDAANELMRHGFGLAKEAGCPVQIHAETATPESFQDLADHARKAGIATDRLIKHYSTPIVDTDVNHGLWPSVLVGKDAAETAIQEGTRFLMETDYMDDPRYPGAVLGPKTVPKRTLKLLQSGVMTEEQAWQVHKHNAEELYGVTIEL